MTVPTGAILRGVILTAVVVAIAATYVYRWRSNVATPEYLHQTCIQNSAAIILQFVKDCSTADAEHARDADSAATCFIIAKHTLCGVELYR